jgi:hypothetical protein
VPALFSVLSVQQVDLVVAIVLTLATIGVGGTLAVAGKPCLLR